MLDRHGFVLGSRTALNFNLFATETTAVLFIDYSLEIQCDDVRGEGREGVLRLKGDGSYLPASQEFSGLRNFGEQLTFRLPDGTIGEMRNAMMFAEGIVFGHREVSSLIRYPLSRNEP